MPTTPELGTISTVSNELEFFLTGTTAPAVLHENTQRGNPLELTGEVNPLDALEMMVSMSATIEALNHGVGASIAYLHSLVESLGGQMYAGSAFLGDVSQREPQWYRTTSLSRTLGEGFLSIGSQQLVLGIAREGAGTEESGENFGFALYNFLRSLSPIVLALSASSPYSSQNGALVDTNQESFRPGRYAQMSQYLPQRMFQTPVLHSLEEYFQHLQTVSDEVNVAIERGQLDSVPQLQQHLPFTTLEPHQIYSWVRIRPDHANADSVFSLEVRIADIAHRVETILALNAFIGGLAYYATDSGFDELRRIVAPLQLDNRDTLNAALQKTALQGLQTKFGPLGRGTSLATMATKLTKLATQGLVQRGQSAHILQQEMQYLLSHDSVPNQIRSAVHTADHPPTTSEVEQYYAQLLTDSLHRTSQYR
ncbi:hypothetical protein LRY65_00300 [Candidatus Woesebacteria bacterium]|nr:hypothetical protein [Candidatus Woesebacteria bacterium]MCD8507756.1 hypothetical protein [Candidatus Woesebacteria bacterium]MCD8526646.1 hypothetical protein [Candidatus Woesebacteria bacterium]MCD8545886.1 hypothetical protein [Candidatus Woesebacteria bacterium]